MLPGLATEREAHYKGRSGAGQPRGGEGLGGLGRSHVFLSQLENTEQALP